MMDDNDGFKIVVVVLLFLAFVACVSSWNCGKTQARQSPRYAWQIYVEAQEWVKRQ